MKKALLNLASSSFKENKTPIWMASNFLLSRNLSSCPFPHKMSLSQAKYTSKVLQEALLNTPLLQAPSFLTGDQMNSTEKEFLSEYFFALNTFQIGDKREDFIIDETSSFLASINGQNHLILQSIEYQSGWTNAWNKLSQLEEHLAEVHDFAYSHQFGYLTSDKGDCGTGLSAQVFLHLPALNYLDRLEEILEKEIEDTIETHGIGGGKEFIGDIVIIKNHFSIGVTEELILENVHKTTTSLISLEKEARDLIIKNPPPLILDKVSRAYALIKHSFQIEILETFEALSLIKLGIDLNWIGNVTNEEVTKTLFKCQRAHLSLLFDEEMTKETLSLKRAHFLQEKLKNMTLNLP